MSYLEPGFDPDIFISYAHIDNQPPSVGREGWIDCFHHTLEKRLAERLGKRTACYRDPVEGYKVLTAALKEKVHGTAIFVSVVSPGYVESEWCLMELAEFCAAAERKGGLNTGSDCRLLKIIKLPPRSRAKLLPDREDPIGYQFYREDPRTGVPREVDPSMGEIANVEFRQKVDDVASHVVRLLDALSRNASERPVRKSSGLTVYLAETTRDLVAERDQIRRELLQLGHTVLPDSDLPWAAPDFARVVQEQLGRAQLSIHLVGAKYGLIPEGEKRSVVSLQYRYAMERGLSPGARLVWTPPDVAATDERQLRFLSYLETDPDAQKGADFLRTSLEGFKTVIRDALEKERRRGEPTPQHKTGPAARITYLICDESDRQAVRPLQRYLSEHGFVATLPPQLGEDAGALTEHTERLSMCDAALIYCGQVGETWLLGKLKELRKAAGYRSAGPMVAQAVFLGPGRDDRWKQEFEVPKGLLAFRQLSPFNPTIMEPFLERLRTT
jgi:hypothetical protein